MGQSESNEGVPGCSYATALLPMLSLCKANKTDLAENQAAEQTSCFNSVWRAGDNLNSVSVGFLLGWPWCTAQGSLPCARLRGAADMHPEDLEVVGLYQWESRPRIQTKGVLQTRTAFAISSLVLSGLGQERNGILWLCKWFPWNLPPSMCSNSSGRGLILPLPAAREPRTSCLCQRGVHTAVPVLLLAGVHLCTGAMWGCQAEDRVLAALCRVGRCFTHCDTPHWKGKGLSLIFSEMLFKQCLQSYLHSTENSEI